MKKALSLLLAVLMVFTLLPVSALADGETPGTAEPTTKAETTPTPEETPIPEGTPEPEETPTPERTPEPEETLTPEDTPEPEDQTKYPWEDMTDEEFAAYIYAEENREYLISLMTGADEAAYISFADRIERIEDEELYVQLSSYLYSLSEQSEDDIAMLTSYSVVMSADKFIGYLKYILNRKTGYGIEWPYNVGYYDGDTIFFDCWNMGLSIIISNGEVAYNETKGNYVSYGVAHDYSCGANFDLGGNGILNACESYSSDFSSIIPGEWLFMDNGTRIYHVGYYIGDGKVIECTSGSFQRVIESSIDSNGYS